MLKFAAITPHPPIIVSGVGGSESEKQVSSTIKAMKELRVIMLKEDIDTIFLISPHAKTEEEYFLINKSDTLNGSLEQFGNDYEFNFNNDMELLDLIKKHCHESSIPLKMEKFGLDHGSLVPLYFLSRNGDYNLVQGAFSFASRRMHFEYGIALKKAFEESEKKIAVIASGDLSHRITLDAPAGYDPKGKEFDKQLIDHLSKGETRELLTMDEELISAAGECGYRSILILLGMFNDIPYEFKKLSYEAPFGVGYLTAQFQW